MTSSTLLKSRLAACERGHEVAVHSSKRAIRCELSRDSLHFMSIKMYRKYVNRIMVIFLAIIPQTICTSTFHRAQLADDFPCRLNIIVPAKSREHCGGESFDLMDDIYHCT